MTHLSYSQISWPAFTKFLTLRNLRSLAVSFILSTICLVAYTNSALALSPSVAKQPRSDKFYHEGNVYTMRGGLLGIFSTGMALLANTLKTEYNVHAANTVYHDASGLSSFIIKHYKTHHLQGPIILVGHSLGANEQIKVADELATAHIPVTLLITVDAGLPLKIPDNVQQVLNLYQPTIDPVFKGVPLQATNSQLTYVENVNVSTIKNVHVNHFNISQNSKIQEIMLKKILAVLDTKKS